MRLSDCYGELLAYTDALLDAVIASDSHKEIIETPAVQEAYIKFSENVDKYFKEKMAKERERAKKDKKGGK